MSLLIQYTLVFATILTLVALGGMFSERSGVINLGLEGCMVIGALVAVILMRYVPKDINAFVIVVLVVLVSSIGGMIYSMLLAVAAIKFKADQTITGTALNILAPALATVIVKAITLKEDGKATAQLSYNAIQKNFTFNIGSLQLSWFTIIMFAIVIAAYIILYKTKFGLRLMSCGEHPQASASAGIDVIKMRYIGVGISGLLSGFGGLTYIACVNSTWTASVGVAGFGFLALAVMIFGQWKPTKIFLGALLFGFFRTLGNVYNAFDWLKEICSNSSVYLMLPYIVCLIVLAITSKKSRAPKAEGQPYEKGMR